ncbi:hypothetical protein AA313_de0203588 [Arthrobotrys entomopaga]|nr:hypothetical protein AA313_de0203588 [Arthrobotrys entomopaga]
MDNKETESKKTIKSALTGLVRRASQKTRSGAKQVTSQVTTLVRSATHKKKKEMQVTPSVAGGVNIVYRLPNAVYLSPDAPPADEMGGATEESRAAYLRATSGRMNGCSLRIVTPEPLTMRKPVLTPLADEEEDDAQSGRDEDEEEEV